MKKRVVTALLAAMMAVTALVGCSSKDGAGKDEGKTDGKTEEGASSDKVTLTFATLGTEAACQAQVLEAINKKLAEDGLDFEIAIKQVDDYWNKLALDIAGGTEYDLAWAHASTLPDLVAKKVYQPIGAALDSVGQDLKEKTPEYVLAGGTVKGEVYAIPRAIPSTGFASTYDVRRDLMQKYGMESITTLEELETYFQAVLDNEEGVFPYVGTSIQPLFPVMGNYYYFVGDGAKALYIDPADPTYTVKSFWESEEFVKMCDKKREWKEKGWLPSDITSIENADTGFDYGQVAAVDSNVMRVSERVDTVKKNIEGGEAYTVYLEPEKRWIFSAGDNMLAVPSTSKHPEEAVQFIQWFKCNQDNYDLWSYGVEGVNYEKDGEGVDITNIATEEVYSPMTWMWNDIDKARFSAQFDPAEIQRLKDWDNNSEVPPMLGFTLDQTAIKAEVSQIIAVMSEYSDNLSNGALNIHDVQDEIVKKLKSAGLDKVIEEAQKQINEYVKK